MKTLFQPQMKTLLHPGMKTLLSRCLREAAGRGEGWFVAKQTEVM